jgi:hypothetical protein
MYRAHTRPLYALAWYDNLRRMLWVVFAGTILLLWRACYRLAEVILGESARFTPSSTHTPLITFYLSPRQLDLRLTVR